jgi:hypothetical protein
MAKDTGQNTLDPEINLNPVDGLSNDAVKQYLEVISRNNLQKTTQDSRNQAIQDLFKEAFEISSPDGTRKINSQRLYQALWRTASRMKPLDFAIHGTGVDPNVENVVTQGVATVMDRGGYDSSLRDKAGAFFNLLMYGDGFIQVGSSPDGNKEIPIRFNSLSNKNVYVDNFATGLRTKGWGRNASKVVIVFSYSWGDFCQEWPDFKTKASVGKIPRDVGTKDLQRTQEQEALMGGEEIEVAYGYDINNKNFTVFAGSACTVIEELSGEDYPFMMNKEAYIPVSQFICMPSSEGFWNHGIGAMVYKLAVISRQLLNMEINHIEDNVYPVELVSVSQGQAASFFNKLQTAHKMRAAGKKAYVTMERDPADPNSSAVNSQTLTTQGLFNEWQAVFDRLDQEIRRLGINIDELETTSGTTATEILALEENSNAFVKQIMEYNASESQFLVNLTIDFIKQFVPKSSKAPLDLTTAIEIGGKQERASGFTMGQLSQTLRESHFFTRINARTGAIPSRALERAQFEGALRFAQPGSKAQTKIIGHLARLSDLDIPGEEFGVQQEAPQIAAAELPGAQEGAALPAGTDRLSLNPRGERTPVL